MKTLFTEHPNSVNETYGQHMVMSASFGVAMLCGAFAAMVHAVFPFLFEKTGSAIITRLHDRMVTNRVRLSGDARQPAKQAPIQPVAAE
ncbi:DUF6356 family protein [Denitrobaculum tricleocarpae]|uniref:Capsule biosynthesis protein n=1 Tax=Denitrobaculum tricleocarpae TaxID=2591009 RepID=A0A545TUD9_9PROT|nr:DUF6356 family protein [Denitrobaculum tricleocarpae]TQV80835.1 hypothetical protein FKG95_11850 [Denitrobaculum tricleocarpae]